MVPRAYKGLVSGRVLLKHRGHVPSVRTSVRGRLVRLPKPCLEQREAIVSKTLAGSAGRFHVIEARQLL